MSKTPPTSRDEALAAALLPVLLHRINNTTQTLLAVRALVGEGDMPPRCSNDLAAASAAAHEEGWLLGVIAGGLGANLLMARHERDGLVSVVRLVRDALRRNGRDLAWDANEVPKLKAPRDASSPAAGQVCWTVATLLWHAGAHLPDGSALRIVFEPAGRSVLRGDGGADDDWLAIAEAERARLGEDAACSRDGATWRFELPLACTELAR